MLINQILFKPILIIIFFLFIRLYFFYLKKDYRDPKTGFFFNLSIETFVLLILLFLFKINYKFFQMLLTFISIILLFIGIILVISSIDLIFWNFKLSNNTKYRSRYRSASILVLFFCLIFLLIVIIQFFGIKLNSNLEKTLSFIPLYLYYIIFVFLNFLTQTILVNLKGKNINKKRSHYAFIITLGCGLINGTNISKNLFLRLKKTLEFAKKHNAKFIIVSGGKGEDEKISEAEAMKKWLIKKNYPVKKIITEKLAHNTIENLSNSFSLIKKQKKVTILTKTIFITNSYHLPRANIIAHKRKLKTFGVPASTPKNYFASGWLREFVAILIINKKRHLIILLILFFFSLCLLNS